VSADIGVGMVHGRFQPLHGEHLEYIVAASARCRELVVGITNPDARSSLPEAADPERHLPEANPFTYYERLVMVEAALAAALPERSTRIVPFPIEDPALWRSYVPHGAVHLLRVLSPWGREKAQRLRAAGHHVTILESDAGKGTSGAAVRAAMRAGAGWEALVPPEVAAVIASLPRSRAQAAGLAA
jgi:nicotinamide mononucleotide adenylyltransferase